MTPPTTPQNRPSGGRSAGTGRPSISPIWIFMAIALVGSLALVVYAFVKRDTSQIPLLTTAAAILGIVLLVLAGSGAVATYRAARDGRAGRAVATAIGGGIAAMAAAGAFAVATILGLLYHP
ncbi:MAG: hypothetical protein ACRDGQ_08530 [Candidatus Limnocylindrales bacterium]